jgi:putative ABC transport system permease protein
MSDDSRMRRLFSLPKSQARIDRAIDEELRFHLAEREAELRGRGVSPEAARAGALAKFGNVSAAQRELHDIDVAGHTRSSRREQLRELVADTRYVIRSLARQPGIVLAAIGTLALGTGANAAMFGIVDRLLLSPPPHVRDPGQVVQLRVEETPLQSGRMTWDRVPYHAFDRLRRDVTAFASVAGHMWLTVSLGAGEEARQLQTLAVSPSYFSLLGPRPEVGGFFGAADGADAAGERVVVLSHALWSSAFAADPSIVGREVRLSDQAYRVVGVAPRGFSGDGIGAVDAWIPMISTLPGLPDDWQRDRDRKMVSVVARLRAGAERTAAMQEAGRIYRASLAGTAISDSTAAIRLRPLIAARADDGEINWPEARVALWLQAVSLALLLVAGANVMNLLLLRASQRRREIAIRLALGISRARLLRQALTESVLIALGGGVLAAGVSAWGGGVVRRALLPQLGHLPLLDARMLAVVAALSLLAALALGVIPAVLSSNPRLSTLLRTGDRGSSQGRSRLQSGLLFMQVALSVVLLIGAGLFVRSLGRMTSIDLGMQPDRVLVVRTNMTERGRTARDVEDLLGRVSARALAMPGVETTAIGRSIPYNPSLWSPIFLPGRDKLPGVGDGGAGHPTYFVVTPDYFRTLGMRVVAGRGISEDDRTGGAPVMLVDETMARRFWPGESAIGKCVKVGGDTMPCRTVVGVVHDTKRNLSEREHSMRFYLPLAQAGAGSTSRYLFVRISGDAGVIAPAIRRTVAQLDPSLSMIEVFPLASLLDPQTRPWRLGSTLFGMFGLLALVVAAIGLYTLIAAGVVQRQRELGVRIALGASRAALVSSVLRAHAGVTLAGIGTGALLSALVLRRLESLLYDTRPFEPEIYAAVVLAMGAVALVAATLPAWRASRVDPMIAMRAD